VPAGATACPGCGSDERTGWSETARYNGLDLPDEHFDYDEFAGREFEGRPSQPRFLPARWPGAVLMLLILLLALMGGC
jgi:hypothetical protein